MSNVFANGLEISGKAAGHKTIAAFPDVCFTPPENPATPPGVPVPYPCFGIASDTDKGTGTVKIGGKTVNIKNQSFLSKTTGTEAGCAAKKGVISSTNTGKEFFRSWSPNVKFDGEPVIRTSDLSTSNHASEAPNEAVPWPHIDGISLSRADCEPLLLELGIHAHKDKDCPPGQESEHFVRVTLFQSNRKRNRCFKSWKNYNNQDAPCICMQARHMTPKGKPRRGKGSKKGTPHHGKTMQEAAFIKKKPKMLFKDALQKSVDAVRAHHPVTKNLDSGDETQKQKAQDMMDCLKLKMLEYLMQVLTPKKTESEIMGMTTRS